MLVDEEFLSYPILLLFSRLRDGSVHFLEGLIKQLTFCIHTLYSRFQCSLTLETHGKAMQMLVEVYAHINKKLFYFYGYSYSLFQGSFFLSKCNAVPYLYLLARMSSAIVIMFFS